MRGNTPSKLLGKYANRYPERVIREAGRLYGLLGRAGAVGKELGIPATVISYWRSRYAWKKPLVRLSELPTQWQCACGRRCTREAVEQPLCKCGTIPGWAA